MVFYTSFSAAMYYGQNHTHISDFLFESYVLGTIEHVTNCACDSKVIHSVDVQLMRHPMV